MKDQEPFNIANELGDLGYRIIPQDVDSAQLMVTHHHYDHSDADKDINVVFPIDVLRDALILLTENTRPGEIITREYPEYGEQYEQPRVRI